MSSPFGTPSNTPQEGRLGSRPARVSLFPDRRERAELDQRPLSQRAAAGIRGAILSGELPTGQPLRQLELAARFGVSPIPLREAFRQLEAERLVVIHPYRGAVVAPLSRQEAQQAGEMVLALGTLAIRWVVPNLKPETLDRASAILEAMKAETDPLRWEALSLRLYAVLGEPAGRPYLVETIRGLLGKAARYRTIALGRRAHREELLLRHVELVAAGRRRDADAAVKALERMVRASVDEASRLLSRRPSLDEGPAGAEGGSGTRAVKRSAAREERS